MSNEPRPIPHPEEAQRRQEVLERVAGDDVIEALEASRIATGNLIAVIMNRVQSTSSNVFVKPYETVAEKVEALAARFEEHCDVSGDQRAGLRDDIQEIRKDMQVFKEVLDEILQHLTTEAPTGDEA